MAERWTAELLKNHSLARFAKEILRERRLKLSYNSGVRQKCETAEKSIDDILSFNYDELEKILVHEKGMRIRVFGRTPAKMKAKVAEIDRVLFFLKKVREFAKWTK